MFKLKTKKSSSKRFEITKNGKIKRKRAFGNHILTKKSKARKRKYRQTALVFTGEARNVKRMLPYSC